MSPVRIQLPLPDTRFSYDTWGSPAVVDDVLLAVVAKPCIIWPVGQAVKTSPFHGGNPGSIPGRVTKQDKSEPYAGGRRVRICLLYSELTLWDDTSRGNIECRMQRKS